MNGRRGAYALAGDAMGAQCDPLALTTGINALAAALARELNDEELTLTAAVLTQLGDTLATIAAQRSVCGR